MYRGCQFLDKPDHLNVLVKKVAVWTLQPFRAEKGR